MPSPDATRPLDQIPPCADTSHVTTALRQCEPLLAAIRAQAPVIVVDTLEEVRARAVIAASALECGQPVFYWSVTSGLRRDLNPAPILGTDTLTGCLRHVGDSGLPGLYVLLDADPFLADAVNLRLIREIAMGHDGVGRTLILVGERPSLTVAIDRICARVVLPPPDVGEIAAVIHEEAVAYGESRGVLALTEPLAVDQLRRVLAGLPLTDARRVVRDAVADDGAITRADLGPATAAKHEWLARDGVLSLEQAATDLSRVGGLVHLKRWLALRQGVFLSESPVAGIDPPKGVMLLGVQGGGKSLAAQAVAGSWGVPLMRLDMGAVYDKFVGESERRMRDALATAEVMAPCVLWIDEIEKGLGAGGDGEGAGISGRVLGTLLTWLAGRRARVFTVATANAIDELPPELVRKGRFDEIFFVDLPDTTTRGQIVAIHLGRRGLNSAHFDLPALAGRTEGFTGAEIEQAIVAALYEALGTRQALSTNIIAAEIARTQPLSVTMAERVDTLRTWAAGRTVPAG